MKSIQILKNRSDIGAGSRGSDLGIDAMEIAAINIQNDFFNRYDYEDISTRNEAVYNKLNHSFAKRIQYIAEQCRRVCAYVQKALKNDKFLLVLSGDHSSALGTIAGIKATFLGKRIGVIWIDAHADIHSPYSSPSGNVHGMSLAATLAEDNLDCQTNDPSLETKNIWEQLKNIGTSKAKILPEDLVYFGVRDTESSEDYIIEKLGIRNYKVAETRYRGLNKCVNEALDTLKNTDLIYISFDVDSLDCDLVSYGTGTPVPKGFSPDEVQEIISQCIDSKKVVCIEFSEINPLLDTKGNAMAETAFRILDNIAKQVEC